MRTREAHTCAVGALSLALSVKSAIGTVTFVKATSMLLVYSEQLHTPQSYTVCVQWRQPLYTLHNVHMWPVLCSSQPSARKEVLLMCWIYMTLLFVYTYSLPSPCSFYRYRETRENDWREEGTYNIRTYVHVHVILQRLFVTL